MTDQTWLRTGPAGEPGLPRLLCLPYSGTGASQFRDWPAALAGVAEVAALQLPGREDRLGDKPVEDVHALLADLVPAVLSWWRPPFVVFGHCMGALVAGELLAAIARAHGNQPAAVVLSGTLPTWADETGYDLGGLSDAALIRRLRAEGALSARMLAEPALLTFMLPAARADATLCETIRDTGEPAHPPLSAPLWLFAAREDPRFRPAQLRAWEPLSTGHAELCELPGGHEYLATHQDEVLDAVRGVLAAVAR